jgi:hypothetical protein
VVATTTAGLPDNPHQIVQVVSSPLSLVSPIAASASKGEARWLPPVEPRFEPAPVQYPLQVPTYRCAGVLRTEEHAMTISFWQRGEGAVGVKVRTWLARAAARHAGPSFETTLVRR